VIDALARLLGIRPDQTEDALRSERAARATLNRRGFLLAGATAGAALATGAIFSLPSVEVAESIVVAKGLQPGSTLTSFDYLLKQHYLNADKLEALLYEPSPFLQMIGPPERWVTEAAS